MDNNQNPYQFPNPQGQQSNVPPPPPSQEAQVGIRSMQSDLESIKQSGGEAPQSQIINAPELAQFSQSAAPAQPQYTPPAPPTMPSVPPTPPTPPTSPSDFSVPSEPIIPPPEVESKKSFSIKTVLLIVGGLIFAGAIGYGAYYLVTTLSATPTVEIPVTQNNLPVPSPAPAATTTVNPTSPSTPVVASLVHQSVILSPTKSEVHQLADKSVSSFEMAVATSSAEKLIVGSVKDLAFTNTSGTPMESTDFFQAYFAPESPTLVPLFDRDFTSWLYFDKLGGAKLGVVLPLKDSVTTNQASSGIFQSRRYSFFGFRYRFVCEPHKGKR